MLRLFGTLCIVAILLFLTSCGEDDDPTGVLETTPPTVQGTQPANGASDLGLLQAFEITFSEPMNPASLNESTVALNQRGDGLHLVYREDEHVLWAAPESLLAPGANLRLSISDGARDLAGNRLEPFGIDFSTGPFDCAHLADRFEPNEDPATATTLQVDSLYPALSTCREDEDYYRFTLSDTAKVTAKTFITHADDVSWGINWRREDGDDYSTLGTGAETGSEKTYYYTFLPGTYYLQIHGIYDEEYVLYDLILETGEPCPEDPYEDNDFEDTAAAIVPGLYEGLRGCHVDADWYSFNVAAGQTIAITMESEPYSGSQTRRLILQEPGGTGIHDTNFENPITGTLPATESGTATVMVQFWVDGVVYSLRVQIYD